MREIYLGLGSNLGDRFQLMKMAVEYLRGSGKFHDIRVSSLYETEPVGYVDQPPFLNAVFRGETELTPFELLELCQELENHLERVRIVRWGPRTIDADILLFGTLEVNETQLEIPHPRMFERSFVLIPLTEICSPEVSAYYGLPDKAEQLSRQGIRKLEYNEATIEWYSTHNNI